MLLVISRHELYIPSDSVTFLYPASQLLYSQSLLTKLILAPSRYFPRFLPILVCLYGSFSFHNDRVSYWRSTRRKTRSSGQSRSARKGLRLRQAQYGDTTYPRLCERVAVNSMGTYCLYQHSGALGEGALARSKGMINPALHFQLIRPRSQCFH